MSATDVGGDEFLTAIFAGAEGSVCIARPTKDRGYFQRSWCFGDAATLVPGPWYWCCSTSKATSKVDRDGVTTINRRKSDLARTCALVLDDIGTKVEEARVEQMLPPPSASLETSPGNFQWVYILDGGADPADAEVALARLAMAGLTDASAKDTSHVFRLPGSINDKVAVLERNGGQPWSARVTLWEPERRYTLDEIVERVPRSAEPKAKRKADANGHARHDKPNGDDGLVLDALSSLPGEDDYSEWVRIGMALHAEVQGSPEGYRAFVAWSAKSFKFDAHECERKWREWDRRPADHLTGGTIIYLARQNGWQDPRQRNGDDHKPRPNGEAEDGETKSTATRDWPRPGPIVAELKPVPPFDAGTLLPDVLRAWVMDEAERMPCPPEFVAAAAMVALSSIVGARCAIKPKARDPWLIVPNLWGGIVSDPSAKKSPAWAVALRPLDALIARASETHRQALAEYETERVVFDAQKDAIEGRIKEAAKKASKGDPGVIARELRAHGDQAPAEPILRRYRTNDSTVEKLGELLRDNPTGLLVLRDELVGLIANWEREGREGERAFFLEAWNGNQAFDTDRIGRGHISIANLCLAIFGGIQPDKLVIYLEQAAHALGNDGMLQRFQLLVYPDPRPWEWRDRLPDKTARDAAFDVFNKLAEFDPAEWGASPADEMAKFPWFRFGDEAQRVFIEWSEDLHRVRMPAEDDPIIRQHLAKYDKLFPALALVLHLVDLAAGGQSGPVSLEAALRAGAWCEFLEAHARRCYGLLKDDGLRGAQALAAKLERNKLEDGFTLRDVRRNQWRSLTTDEAIQAALDWLEDEDWLRSESTGGTGPGSGRRTVSYKINPGIARKGKGEGA